MKATCLYLSHLCSTVFFVFLIQVCSAQVVTSEADDGSTGTLRREIMDAPPGTHITIASGVNHIKLNGQMVINKNITLSGNGPDETKIDGNGMGRIFLLQSCTLNVEKMTLTNGVAADGGAIMAEDSRIFLRLVNITNCTANGLTGSGGAIFLGSGSSIAGMRVTFEGNQANRAGGAIEDQSGNGLGINLNNAAFQNNNAGVAPATAAPGNGGAIHVTGKSDVSLSASSFQFNAAASEGGAIWNDMGKLTLAGCQITQNTASGDAADNGGGGIFNNGGELDFLDTKIIKNKADGNSGSGGGLLSVDGTILMQNTQLNDNAANRAGAGVELIDGNLTMNASKLIRNYFGTPNPGNGAGLHVSGAANTAFKHNFIYENKAASEGGGLWNNTGKMTINNCVVANNIASGNASDQGGAGIFNNGGDVEINQAQIRDNFANGTSGSGGALFSTNGTITVNRTEFLRNKANRAGAGVELIDGRFTLVQGKFEKNVFGSPNPGNGAGLHTSGNASVYLENSQAFDNIADSEGGALWNGKGSMTIKESYIHNNRAMGNTTTSPLQIKGGGAVFVNGGRLSVLEGTVFEQNFASGTAGSGGAILVGPGARLDITGVDGNRVYISNNGAHRAGGGIEDWSGNLTISTLKYVDFFGNGAGVRVLGNNFAPIPAPGNGGALHVTGNGDVFMQHSTLRGNNAASDGGALWNAFGKMTIKNVAIYDGNARGNGAQNGGGAIYNNGGDLEINESAIYGNNALGTLGSGGALFSVDGIVTIDRTRFEGNRANRAGGAIEMIDGVLNMSWSLISKNSFIVPSPGSGAGVHVSGTADTSFLITQIIDNTAPENGGGIYSENGTITLEDCAIRGNFASGTLSEAPFEVKGGGGIYLGRGASLLMEPFNAIENNKANGAAGSGGGILMTPGAKIAVVNGNAQIVGNSATRSGGGLEIWSLDAPSVDLTGIGFKLNTAGVGVPANPGNGGGLHVTGNANLNMRGGEFRGNLAANAGGAVYNDSGVFTISNCLVHFNDTEAFEYGKGGAFYNHTGTLNISQTDFWTNGAAFGGGAIYNENGVVNLSRGRFTRNTAQASDNGSGGALYNNGGTMTTDHIDFDENKAAKEGGAIWNGNGVLEVSNARFWAQKVTGNNNPKGGALLNSGGVVNMLDNTFTFNRVDDQPGFSNAAGAAIANINDGKLNLEDVRFTYNQTNGYGGGIADFSPTSTGEVNLKNVKFVENTTKTGNGGGLFLGGAATAKITNSSFIYNSTESGLGSAIFNEAGSLEIQTTTISRNRTANGGPSIYNVSGEVNLEAVTVAENFGINTEGGLGGDGGSFNLSNTVVAVNSGGLGDISPGPSYNSSGYNFVEDFQNLFPSQSTDIMSTQAAFINPRLESLPYSGGYYVMIPESPLINKGNPADNFPDQIGNPVFGPRRDIGAIEAQFMPLEQNLASEEALLDQSVLFPNPVKFGSTTLRLPSGISGEIAIEIFEMSSGRLMTRQVGQAGQNTLHVSNFAGGTYLVKVTSGSMVQSEKLIVNH